MEHAMWEDDNAAVGAAGDGEKHNGCVWEWSEAPKYIYIYTLWLFNIAIENGDL